MTWGAAEIAAYREAHPLGTTARLAIELLLNVAARRGDAHELGLQHVKERQDHVASKEDQAKYW